MKKAPCNRQTPSKGRWPIILLLTVIAFCGTWALFEFVIWNTLPGPLVGKWVISAGEQEGATFDFQRNGVMIGRINMHDREAIIDAHVRVTGSTLYITTHNPSTGEAQTKMQTIKTLTAHNLTLEDERGNIFEMKRAQ